MLSQSTKLLTIRSCSNLNIWREKWPVMLKYVTVNENKRRKMDPTKDSEAGGACANAEAAEKPKSDKTFAYTEKKGDLFGVDSVTSLAHCVSVDLRMGKGIAVIFKNKFGGLKDLQKQNKKVGEVAILSPSPRRHIYYLITKEKYWNKPTYDSLRGSLEAMRDHCQIHQVRSLAMPKIGCGLDGLKWDKVAPLIKDVFKDLNISVTVYYL